MKYFVLSDIHGDYDAMVQGLIEAHYDENDPSNQLIVIGDFFGRASTSEGAYGVWKFLTSNIHKNKPICIKGNHEAGIVQKILERGYATYLDIQNGEGETIDDLYAHLPETCKTVSSEASIENGEIVFLRSKVKAINNSYVGSELLSWLKSLPYYYETDFAVFTHGWLPFRETSPKDDSNMKYTYKDYDLYSDDQWEKWVWCITPEMYKEHIKHFPDGWDKTIVVGHWHSFAFSKKGKKFGKKVFYHLDLNDFNYVHDVQHKVVFCDHCTALGHRIHVLVIEDGKII